MVTHEIPFHPHVFVSIPLLLTYISDSFPSDGVKMRYSSGIRREEEEEEKEVSSTVNTPR